jgi:hypothetical protein
MVDKEKKTKPKYEAPIVVPLGEMARGAGDCSPGSGDTGTCTSVGGAATGTCTHGVSASATCTNGVSAITTCTDAGGAVYHPS